MQYATPKKKFDAADALAHVHLWLLWPLQILLHTVVISSCLYFHSFMLFLFCFNLSKYLVNNQLGKYLFGWNVFCLNCIWKKKKKNYRWLRVEIPTSEEDDEEKWGNEKNTIKSFNFILAIKKCWKKTSASQIEFSNWNKIKHMKYCIIIIEYHHLAQCPSRTMWGLCVISCVRASLILVRAKYMSYSTIT